MAEKETARVEAFSDGVFAIAITLLVLEIKVPHLSETAANRELLLGLLALWPSFLAFVISFGAILIMWVNHHGMFNLIQRVDCRFLYANGFLLLVVAFIPFPTAVLAQHISCGAGNVAAAFYCGTYVAICAGYNLLWHAASAHRRLLKTHVPDTIVRRIRNAYRIAFPIYVAATVIAYFSPVTGLVISSSLWVLWAVLDYTAVEQSQAA
jgi:uncharacterized membrane protein